MITHVVIAIDIMKWMVFPSEQIHVHYMHVIFACHRNYTYMYSTCDRHLQAHTRYIHTYSTHTYDKLGLCLSALRVEC